MHTKYPHGVGKVGAHGKTSGVPVTNFERSNRLYYLTEDSIAIRTAPPARSDDYWNESESPGLARYVQPARPTQRQGRPPGQARPLEATLDLG